MNLDFTFDGGLKENLFEIANIYDYGIEINIPEVPKPVLYSNNRWVGTKPYVGMKVCTAADMDELYQDGDPNYLVEVHNDE